MRCTLVVNLPTLSEARPAKHFLPPRKKSTPTNCSDIAKGYSATDRKCAATEVDVTPDGGNSGRDEDGYTRVTRTRATKVVKNKPKVVIGTQGGFALKVKSGRFVSVFMSRLDPNTTPSQLEQHIMDTHSLAAKCTQLKAKYNSYASFKVEVMCDSVSNVYSPDKWPACVYLRKFLTRNPNYGH